MRGALIRRNQGQGLIDKGRADGVADGDVFEIIRKNGIAVRNEGIGVTYSPQDIVGTLTVTKADEEVSAGNLERRGFFDLIVAWDEAFMLPEQEEETAPAPAETIPGADPELRALLRTLR